MKIKNHRSTTAGVVPSDAIANTEGVFSVNIADTPPSVWVGDGTGVRKIGSVVSGTEPTDPTEGSIWANSNTNDVFMYVNGEWLRLNGGGGIFTPEEQVASAGQTVFNLTLITYQPNTNRMSVYRNGVRLRPTDFDETSSTQVTLAEPASLNDEMLFLSGEEVSDTEEYVLKTGDTMTGDLTVPNLYTTGNVGIGTSTPTVPLEVIGSNTVVFARNDNSTNLMHQIILRRGDGSGSPATIQTKGDGANGIDALAFNVSGERMRIDSDGHAIIPAGVTLGTAAGVYNAANTLDDYEEGTWTPTFDNNAGDLSAPDLSLNAVGYYTKIGRMVYIQGVTSTSGVITGTSGSGVLIKGLPFIVPNTGPTAIMTMSSNESPSYNSPSAAPTIAAFTGGTTYFDLKKQGSIDDVVYLTSDLHATGGNSNRISFSGFYYTDA